MKPRILRPIVLALLVGTAAGAAWSPPAAAQECPDAVINPKVGIVWPLELPDGQDSLECTIDDYISQMNQLTIPIRGSDYGAFSDFRDLLEDGYLREITLDALVSGSGPIELIATLDPDWDRYELVTSTDAGGEVRSRTLYRVILYDPDLYKIGLTYFVRAEIPEAPTWEQEHKQNEDDFTWELEHDFNLRIVLRRLPMQCSMWASVSGDVNGTFYGYVAYYLHSTNGVMVDPEGMAALGQLMGMGSEEIGAAPETADDFADFMAKEAAKARGQEQGGKGDGKKQGESMLLALQDYKLDQELPYEPDADPGVELFGLGDPNDPDAQAHQDALRKVAGIFTGGFALGIQGHLIADTAKGAVFEIESVRATVGASDFGDRIVFELLEGQSGAALTMDPYQGGDLAYGTFKGDLYTRGEYSLADGPSHRLHVHIVANYTALPGQYTCVKVMQ